MCLSDPDELERARDRAAEDLREDAEPADAWRYQHLISEPLEREEWHRG